MWLSGAIHTIDTNVYIRHQRPRWVPSRFFLESWRASAIPAQRAPWCRGRRLWHAPNDPMLGSQPQGEREQTSTHLVERALSHMRPKKWLPSAFGGSLLTPTTKARPKNRSNKTKKEGDAAVKQLRRVLSRPSQGSWNLPLRRRMPYPLGHTARCVIGR